jgi:hypothetical protein
MLIGHECCLTYHHMDVFAPQTTDTRIASWRGPGSSEI